MNKEKLRKLIRESIEDQLLQEVDLDYLNSAMLKEERKEYRKPIDLSTASTRQSNMAIHIVSDDKRISMVLYRPHKAYSNNNWVPRFDLEGPYADHRVVGCIIATKTKKPCISPTFQIKYAALAKHMQGKGYGSLLYGLMFQYCQQLNIGLTSDHTTDTSPLAQKVWKNIENTNQFVKKMTSAQNDTFDYTGSDTPEDPEDDCAAGSDNNPEEMATHHSWQVTGNNYLNVLKDLIQQHNNYLSQMNNSEMYLESLKQEAYDLFMEVI